MSLADRLLDDMKKAMKDREAGKIRLATIRMVRAAQKEAEIAKRDGLTDQEMLDILNRELKKRRDVIGDYQKTNRLDDVIRLQEEISVIKEYLPEQLDENEIRAIIERAVQDLGVTGPEQAGKVMKEIMPGLKGRADGKLINQLVKEILR
ncbi:transamidase gatb domain protein [hydrocarbon metagenome]|uniref:Transamidase gatb domain protein n=1 Tax=hydrocarbon metagenome TaxID=938273 RepID=A0A0W8E6M1_9ZZZZ